MVEELEQEKEELLRAGDEPPKVQGRIKELKAMNAQLRQDGVDLQNAQRARENAQKKGIQLPAESLLPCVDSLERALASPPQDGDEVLCESLQMTLGDPETALDSHDINPYHSEGKDLDRSRHHASGTSSAPADRSAPARQTVLQGLQRGWRIGEQVLRFANVIVSEPPQRANNKE